jgi:hypothetical protein
MRALHIVDVLEIIVEYGGSLKDALHFRRVCVAWRQAVRNTVACLNGRSQLAVDISAPGTQSVLLHFCDEATGIIGVKAVAVCLSESLQSLHMTFEKSTRLEAGLGALLPSLEELGFDGAGVDDDQLHAAVTSLPHLSRLRLSNCPQLKRPTCLGEIELRVLTLHAVAATNEVLALVAQRSSATLQALTVTKAPGGCDEFFLEQVQQRFP